MKKIKKQKQVSKKRYTGLSEIKPAFNSNAYEVDFLLEYPTDRIFRAFKNRTEADYQPERSYHKNF